MSIEYKITALTAAIERLIAALDKNQSAPAPLVEQSVTLAVEPVVEEPVVEQPVSSVSVDALQTRCLELTRIDRANSPKIKAIIASYGASVLKDIPADKLGEFAAKLEELA